MTEEAADMTIEEAGGHESGQVVVSRELDVPPEEAMAGVE